MKDRLLFDRVGRDRADETVRECPKAPINYSPRSTDSARTLSDEAVERAQATSDAITFDGA
jgi:hypothetical protein